QDRITEPLVQDDTPPGTPLEKTITAPSVVGAAPVLPGSENGLHPVQREEQSLVEGQTDESVKKKEEIAETEAEFPKAQEYHQVVLPDNRSMVLDTASVQELLEEAYQAFLADTLEHEKIAA